MSLKFETRFDLCISLPVDCHKIPVTLRAARCSSRLPQTDDAHPQVRVFTTTEPLSGQQLQAAFHFTSFSWAIPHSSAAEDVGRDGGAS